MNTLRIATRKSPMALWQANFIQAKIKQQHPELNVELITFTTAGDRDTQTPLAEIGGKSLFCKELQRALLNNEADIAVHCIKDMAVDTIPGLTLAAICERDDPRDVFVSNHYENLQALPADAVIGTGSPRRTALLKRWFPHIKTKNCRGNVNTRLQKLDDGEYDGMILAACGLQRLGFEDRIRAYLSPQLFIPAIGQGTLGIECRSDDETSKQHVAFLDHTETRLCVSAERAVNQVVGGDCYTPIAAYATTDATELTLLAMLRAGDRNHRIELKDSADNAKAIGAEAGRQLKEWME